MTQILWSPQATRDVESIRAFIARDSPAVAELVAEGRTNKEVAEALFLGYMAG